MAADANNQEELITLVDDQGNETLYQVLFTFESEDYGKSYILLVPAGSEPEEQVDVLAFAFNPYRKWRRMGHGWRSFRHLLKWRKYALSKWLESKG